LTDAADAPYLIGSTQILIGKKHNFAGNCELKVIAVSSRPTGRCIALFLMYGLAR